MAVGGSRWQVLARARHAFRPMRCDQTISRGRRRSPPNSLAAACPLIRVSGRRLRFAAWRERTRWHCVKVVAPRATESACSGEPTSLRTMSKTEEERVSEFGPVNSHGFDRATVEIVVMSCAAGRQIVVGQSSHHGVCYCSLYNIRGLPDFVVALHRFVSEIGFETMIRQRLQLFSKILF